MLDGAYNKQTLNNAREILKKKKTLFWNTFHLLETEESKVLEK